MTLECTCICRNRVFVVYATTVFTQNFDGIFTEFFFIKIFSSNHTSVLNPTIINQGKLEIYYHQFEKIKCGGLVEFVVNFFRLTL